MRGGGRNRFWLLKSHRFRHEILSRWPYDPFGQQVGTVVILEGDFKGSGLLWYFSFVSGVRRISIEMTQPQENFERFILMCQNISTSHQDSLILQYISCLERPSGCSANVGYPKAKSHVIAELGAGLDFENGSPL